MPDDPEQSSDLEDFKWKVTEVLELLNRDNIPIIVSGDGRPEAVFQDAAGHQQALDAIEHRQTIDGIHAGLTDAERGRSQSLNDALESLLSGKPGGTPGK